MIQRVEHIGLSGDLIIPSSKSDGQRALLIAALSSGTSVIRNLGISDDELAMLKNIQLLGAKVTRVSELEIEVVGIEIFPEYLELNVGESGLGLRLLSGICATQKGTHIITGNGSILNRDQSFFERNLSKYGVEVSSQNGKLPIVFKGAINADEIEVDGSESSQYISGLLLGFALSDSSKVLNVNNLKSSPYVDMTLDTLAHFGVEVLNENHSTYRLNSTQNFTACVYTVESDWSSASYWLVASAIGANLSLSGLNLDSKQADIRFLDALKLSGCSVELNEVNIRVSSKSLNGFEYDATDCPDLFPALVVLASKCRGITKLNGVNRLANKESNRGLVLQKEFGKLGVEIELEEDVMIIQGNSILKSNQVDSNHDHRIAMSLAILGTTIEGGIEIVSAEAVSKSYPQFWEHLNQLSVG